MWQQPIGDERFGARATGIERVLVNALLVGLACLPLAGGYVILGEFHVQNAVSQTRNERVEVLLHYSVHGIWPADASGWRDVDAESRVRTEHGAITVYLSGNAPWGLAGRQLTLRPAMLAGRYPGAISWVCGDASRWPQLVVHGEDRTDVHPRFFDFSCP